MSANYTKAPPLSPASLAIGWVGMLEQPITCLFLFFLSFPGETPKKKKYLPTFKSVLPPPEKKMQSMVPAQTPQILPLKAPMEDAGITRAHQVSVGVPVTPGDRVEFFVFSQGPMMV